MNRSGFLNGAKAAVRLLLQLIQLIISAIPRMVQAITQAINKRLRFSITFKTTVTYSLIFSTLLFMLGVAISVGFGFFLSYQFQRSLHSNLELAQVMITDPSRLPQAELQQLANIEHIVITLYDEAGQVRNRFEPATADEFRSWPINITPTDAFNQLVELESPVTWPAGQGKLTVAKSAGQEIVSLLGLIVSLLIAYPLVLLITVVTGSRTSRKMLKPIDDMTRTARSISVGALDTRLAVVDSHDELKELAETFNEMLNRIQTSFEQQNTFVADASHELKTPIAVIQGYTNLLQRWGKEDPAVLQESLDALQSEADYMKDLIEKLLMLASADRKDLNLQTASFRLDDLVDEVVKETRLIDSSHQISSDRNDLLTVNGDRGLMKQALRIFIDNSLKYTPEGGKIMINSYASGTRALISIADTGVGISSQDLPYIFNRFYKVDKSRSRESGGSGLGLSIANWIIEQHQGKIKVISQLGQGTEVLLSLPSAS